MRIYFSVIFIERRRPLQKNNNRFQLLLSKRECNRYVPSTQNVDCCSCGRTWAFHKTQGVKNVGDPDEVWDPTLHTSSTPTDAYGTIDFLGGPHSNKSQFIRLSFDSSSDLILQLLTEEWGLDLPKVIISVHGGRANFELSERLKAVLRHGLLRAAKSTGSIILVMLAVFFAELIYYVFRTFFCFLQNFVKID